MRYAMNVNESDVHRFIRSTSQHSVLERREEESGDGGLEFTLLGWKGCPHQRP
jgi:hypothetical protein